MILLAILGPLAASVLILLIRRWPGWLALLGGGVALVAALFELFSAAGTDQTFLLPGLPGYPLRLVANPLNVLLSSVTALVGFVVLVYAQGYMQEEKDRPRFFAEMSFFIAAMQALVLAGDWLLLLASWELVGTASYLLIGFWYERPGVKQAATRAFLVTRGADLGLYLGVFLLISQNGTSEIAPTLKTGGTVALLAGLCLLLAAMGKAAQVPFQGWLQDAMLGPTPVSALLHSATLVAAGAILLIKAFPVLPAPVLLITGIVGGLTALVTGIMALAQGDLKRLLASSTSSQLGFMFLALGAGSTGAAVAHLTVHAAMKSALFLGAGIFQHAYESTSFEKLEGKGREFPRVFGGLALAGLALAGVPPLGGFWSKDTVIAATFHAEYAWLLAPLALTGTLLTALYVARALRLLWKQPENQQQEEKPEVPGFGWMLAGLVILAGLAAFGGLAVRPIGNLLNLELPEESLSLITGLVLVIAGLLAGWFFEVEKLLGPLRSPAANGFRFAGGFVGLVVSPGLFLAEKINKSDQGLHRGVLATGRVGLKVAQTVGKADNLLHRGVLRVGKAGMATARIVRGLDEQGIDGLIAGLVKETRRLGNQARHLQSGLIHRELLLTAGGLAVLVVLLLLAGFIL